MRRTYQRLLHYLRPYWRRILLTLVVISLYSALTGFSVTMMIPFLDNLFKEVEAAPVETVLPSELDVSGVAVAPAPGSLDEVEAWKDRTLARARLYLDRGSPSDRLKRIILIIFLALLFKNLFGYLGSYLSTYLAQRSLFDIRQDLYTRIQNLPLGYFVRNKTGVIISRAVNDVNILKDAIIGVTDSLPRNLLTIVIFLTLIFIFNWRLALFTLLLVPPNAWLLRRLGRLLKRDSTRIQERMGEMAGLIQETVTGARVVKAFGREDDEVQRFRHYNWDYFKSAIRLRAFGALNAPLSEMLGTLLAVVIVGYGGHQVLTGNMKASILIAFVASVLSIAGPIRRFAEMNQVFQEGAAAGERVFALMDERSEEASLRDGVAPGPLKEALRYEGVGFCYTDADPVLHGIDLEIGRGQVVALVGPSGAGKSTLADLLPRFYEPDAGRISMDGLDIREFRLGEWRAKMGIVTQDVVLFNDSIFNNIAYGRPGAKRDEVEQAAHAARAHDFVLRASQGYDTVIGERGLQLSGGERQRLAIARAILRDPEILIFDEATSALDTESERLVQEAIERLMTGRTTLVIAHRLSTIQGADKIAVVQAGRIVQEGRHEELLDRGGLYRQLYEMQFTSS